MSCSKCKNTLNEKEVKYRIVCDFCKGVNCLSCSKFTISEAQVTQMKQRVMLYACSDCIDSVKITDSPSAISTTEVNAYIKRAVEGYSDKILKRLSVDFSQLINKVSNTITAGLGEVAEKQSKALADTEGLRSDIMVISVKADSLESNVSSLGNSCRDILKCVSDASLGINSLDGPLSGCGLHGSRLDKLENINQSLLQRIANLEEELSAFKKFLEPLDPDPTPVTLESLMPQPIPKRPAVQAGDNLKNASYLQSSQRSSGSSRTLQQNHSTEPNHSREPLIIGTGSQVGRLSAAERRQWLYLGRCSPSTTEQHIMDYMDEQLGIKDVKCFPLDKNEDVASFKIGVKESLLKGLLESNLWPAGTAIKEFHQRRGQGNRRPANFQSQNFQSQASVSLQN